MQILKWKVEPRLVAEGKQNGKPRIEASSPCPCGCSPKPFVFITDGKLGLTVRFETQEELHTFQGQVGCMRMDDGRCRFCENLVALNKPREKYVGGCKFGLRPEACGKFELAKCYEGHDPREPKKTHSDDDQLPESIAIDGSIAV
jgi:hypothetical protein